MYLSPDHNETDARVIHQFVVDNPLGIFATVIPSTEFPLIQCSHLPWLFDAPDNKHKAVTNGHTNGETEHEQEEDLGTLRGHMARQNPQTKAILESLSQAVSSQPPYAPELSNDVMILFNGPVQHYVTPKWYVETAASTNKVAPGWNYSAVQAYGRAKIYSWRRGSENSEASDAETQAFLTKQLDDLADLTEGEIMAEYYRGSTKPWKVADAHEGFIRLMKKNIIGIEIKITRLECKFRMSQELPKGDREGVIKGFNAMGNEVGRQVAETVKRRGEIKDEKDAAKKKRN